MMAGRVILSTGMKGHLDSRVDRKEAVGVWYGRAHGLLQVMGRVLFAHRVEDMQSLPHDVDPVQHLLRLVPERPLPLLPSA